MNGEWDGARICGNDEEDEDDDDNQEEEEEDEPDETAEKAEEVEEVEVFRPACKCRSMSLSSSRCRSARISGARFMGGSLSRSRAGRCPRGALKPNDGTSDAASIAVPDEVVVVVVLSQQNTREDGVEEVGDEVEVIQFWAGREEKLGREESGATERGGSLLRGNTGRAPVTLVDGLCGGCCC